MLELFINEHFVKHFGGIEMVLNKRQEQTVELVKAEHRASVKRIAQHFFVSEMTVRRDLKDRKSVV